MLNQLSLTPWDISIWLILIAGTSIYGFMVSRGRLVPILFSTYIAYILVELSPFWHPEEYVWKLGAFTAIFLVLLFMLSKVILQSPVGSETFGWALSGLFALLQMGFLLAVITSYLPKELTTTFAPLTRMFFANHSNLFYWASLPVVILLILSYKANQDIEDDDN